MDSTIIHALMVPDLTLWGEFSSNIFFDIKKLHKNNLKNLDIIKQKAKSKKNKTYMGNFQVHKNQKKYLLGLAVYQKENGYSIHIAITNSETLKGKRFKKIKLFQQILNSIAKNFTRTKNIDFYHTSMFSTKIAKSIFKLPTVVERMTQRERIEVQGIRSVIREGGKTKITSVVDVSDDGKKIRILMGFKTKMKLNDQFMISWYDVIENYMTLFLYKRKR